MTEPLRTISHSERGCFNDCRALWAARYLHGHIPLYSHPVKRLGALFEAAFAARLRAWCHTLNLTPWPSVRRDILGRSFLDLDTPAETSPEAAIVRACEREQWQDSDRYGTTADACDLALVLVERAFDAMGFLDGRWRPVVINGFACVQARLTGPLPVPADSHAAHYYPGGASGVLDFFGYDEARNWRPVLVDTKVRETLNGHDIGADPQLALYQHFCAHHGVKVHLCEQWEILGKVPEEPALLKCGKKISKAAEYRATRESFLAVATRHNIDPAPYTDHPDKLDARRWWQATPGGGTDAEVDSLLRDFAADADFMAALANTEESDWPTGKPLTRNLRSHAGSSCTRCDLQTDCHSSHAAGLTLAAGLVNRGPRVRPVIEVDDLDALDDC